MLDTCHRTEAVVLDLEEPVLAVERRLAGLGVDRVEAGQGRIERGCYRGESKPNSKSGQVHGRYPSGGIFICCLGGGVNVIALNAIRQLSRRAQAGSKPTVAGRASRHACSDAAGW